MMNVWYRIQDLFKELALRVPNKGMRMSTELDERDYLASNHIKIPREGKLPGRVDNFNSFTYDQGKTNHCTAYAAAMVATIAAVAKNKNKSIYFDPEIQWQNQLTDPGTASEDLGDYLQSAVKALKKAGIRDPKTNTEIKLKKHKFVIKQEWKTYLAKGYSLLAGGSTIRPFCNFNHYWNPVKKGKGTGGHAWVIVGYDDKKQHYICLNSWGRWGENHQGRFYVRYADAPQLFRGWIIESVILNNS